MAAARSRFSLPWRGLFLFDSPVFWVRYHFLGFGEKLIADVTIFKLCLTDAALNAKYLNSPCHGEGFLSLIRQFSGRGITFWALGGK